MCNITSFHFAVVSDVREGGGEAHHDGGVGGNREMSFGIRKQSEA